MSFEYTDKQLNYLNRGDYVYSVNVDYVKRHQEDNPPPILIVDKKTEELLPGETNIVTVPGNQSFQVIKTYSDPKTGFDGMAVAPIIDGQPDYNSVAVIAAATDTGSKDVDIPIVTAVNPELKLPRDVLTATSGIRDPKLSNGTYLSPQYPVAESFVKEVLEDERVGNIVQLSGYSQSSFMIKVGAKYGIPTTTFNAWFRYGSLSLEEQEFVRKHPELFIDYRNNKDYVVFFNDGNKPELFGYDEVLGTIYWRDGFSHKIEDWDNYDENNGRVINPATGRPFVDGTVNAIRTTFYNMKSFAGLKSLWSGGGISSSEELFLDVAQSYVIGQSMADAAKVGLDEMTALKTKADAEVESIWSKVDFSIYSELSAWEVRDIFASHGVTHQEIVSDFHDYTQKKVKKMEKLSMAFDTLKTKLDEAVESKKALDGKLAGEFSAWHESL